jgi:hypothetical protein
LSPKVYSYKYLGFIDDKFDKKTVINKNIKKEKYIHDKPEILPTPFLDNVNMTVESCDRCCRNCLDDTFKLKQRGVISFSVNDQKITTYEKNDFYKKFFPPLGPLLQKVQSMEKYNL